MSSEDNTAAAEADPQITFKVKTSGEGNHTITMAETATVLDLKTKLSGDDYEKIPTDRMRLIYSGRVMKDQDALSTYKIKAGNTVHMVKSAASNAAQKPSSSAAPTSSAAGVPTNMAAGTANNPLAGLTGARYAGHVQLPGADMFGADGGMGAPPNEDQIASMLEDPNVQQTMNEALNNPAMVDMMINSIPGLANDPNARAMFQSPEFRRMMTNPEAIRQAAAMRRLMGGGAGAGGPSAFPAPGVTDTTPAGAAGSTSPPNQTGQPPFNLFGNMGAGALGGGAGAGAAANPFAALFGNQAIPSQSPAQTPPAPASAGQQTPNTGSANAQNPFAGLFGNAQNNPMQIPGMPPMTPEMMQQAMQMLNSGQLGDMFGSGGFGGMGAGAGSSSSPPPPADTRPPEERYAEQLRQLNDMGFFNFDENVAALRRSGGSVQGAINQLLGG